MNCGRRRRVMKVREKKRGRRVLGKGMINEDFIMIKEVS
jgi:hypothetical protein